MNFNQMLVWPILAVVAAVGAITILNMGSIVTNPDVAASRAIEGGWSVGGKWISPIPAGKTCNGLDATLYGISNGGVTMTFFEGTAGDDVIVIESDGAGSPDKTFVNSDAGDDTVCVSTDDTVVFAGAGDDYVETSGSEDWVKGQDGDDIINLGNGNNMAWGGTGADTITGGNAHDMILGDSGADTLIGGGGDDMIMGGSGNDSIDCGTGTGDMANGEEDTDTNETASCENAINFEL